MALKAPHNESSQCALHPKCLSLVNLALIILPRSHLCLSKVSYISYRIKSICFVEYGSVQEASHARDEVYDVQWPENTGEKVKANFCTVRGALAKSTVTALH